VKRNPWIILCCVLACSSCKSSSATSSSTTLPVTTPAQPGVTVKKKLIDYGWNNPSSQFVRENIVQMEKKPFSGFTLRLATGSDIFNKVAYPDADFEQDRANLKATQFSTLSDNFVVMTVRLEPGWSWFSSADWNAVESNVRNYAKTAAVGKFKGIVFDPEPYGLSPWRYSAETYGGKSFDTVSSVVRERGRSFIKAVHAELPGAKILSFWFLTLLKTQLEQEGGALEKADYALLLPFAEGWLDAAEGETFLDGTENAYYNLNAEDFVENREFFEGASDILSSENQAKYRSSVNLSYGVFLDGVLDLWTSPRFVGFYLKSAAERLKLLEHNVYHSLKNADEYVWVYGENVDWWKGKVPAGLEGALTSARDKMSAGQPLGFEIKSFVDGARMEYDRKVGIGGRVTQGDQGLQSARVLSGFKTAEGKESACVVYNDLGSFDCVVPYGWSGTLSASLEGVKFEPAERTYNKVVQPWTGGQDFVAVP
jgi:hypothetical protein